ncbi:MAG: EAL domain-containing protein [Acidiferrobacter sp.]
MHDAVDAYGPQASDVLGRVPASYTEALTCDLCATFQRGLVARAGADDVISQLTPDDFWESLGAHPLSRLLDTDLKEHALRQSAREMGRILAYIGVENAWLVETYDELISVLRRHIEHWTLPEQERRFLQDTLVSRLMVSLGGIVAGQRQVMKSQQRVMGAITRLIETCTTLSDLARALLDTLLTLDGMVAGTFAKPDKYGTLQYEIVIGATVERHASTFANYQRLPNIHGDDALGRGPSGCAWRSGQIQRSLTILREPSFAPWREIARELGYVSYVAMPILDANREPQAILSLYHSAPGYFSTADRNNLLDRLRSVLSATIARLGRYAPTIHYTARADYRERLAHGALTLLYQPVIDLKSGRLAKVEALARLNNPDGTHIPPADFLPAFGAGDLRRLFALGLRQAITDLRQWEARGLLTAVAINLPAQALADLEYLEIAKTTLGEMPIDPSRLAFEILETDDIQPGEPTRGILAQWRELGVRLAQDDLGSGYSSLLRMERLAVDEVKIDQGFVSTVARSPRKALQFIHHLTRLAHDVGLSVVIEGLESRGLIEAATILGADAGQGYAISRPITANALSSWSRAFRLSVAPEQPLTALGAYAALLLRAALLGLAQTRPTLARHVVAEPCAIATYIETTTPENAALKEAYRALTDTIRDGLDPKHHEEAHRQVEHLLCTEIQREENADRLAHPLPGETNENSSP